MTAPARFGNVPALDGLRGVAVVGVLLFHAGHLEGGYLGVDLFFVLSGFLITSLLLAEWDRTGGIDLRRFWSRRIRRLLPAALVVLVATSVYAAVALEPGELARYRWDAVAALANVANWRAIAAGSDYWASFGTPSPLRHMWSLSIEEQLYVAWPLLVLAALAVGTRVRWGRRLLLALAVGLALVSVAVMAWLGHEGDSTTRAYYGTDTRASAVLVGAIAGIALSGRPWDGSGRVPRVLGRLAVVATIGLGAAWLWADGESRWLYIGGLPALSVAGGVLVAATAIGGGGPFRLLLEPVPLQVLGRISYGVYLWHWPIYVAIDEDAGVSGWALSAVRIGVSIVVAVVSYWLVEQPVRTGTVSTAAWRLLGVLGAGAVVASVALATTGARAEPSSVAEQAPTNRGSGAVSVLLLGDSQAFRLGEGADILGADVSFSMHARIGCGIGPGLALAEDGLAVDRDLGGEPCTEANSHLFDAVDRFDPDIVLLHEGAWDVLDRRIGEEDVAFGTARWDEVVRSNLSEVLTVLRGEGRRVVVLAVPCYPEGGEGGGHTIRDDDRRVARWNELARAVAPSVGAEVVPYDELFCGVPRPDQPDREDGVHLTADGARTVWRWLIPRLRLDG